MKFNVIIGNPPYQSNTGGGTVVKRGKPIYQEFVALATSLNPEDIIMIIPARWYIDDKMEDFRRKITGFGIKTIKDYDNSQMVFDYIMLAGGVSILHLSKSSNPAYFTFISARANSVTLMKLGENYTVNRHTGLLPIVAKVRASELATFDQYVYPSDAFGIPTYTRGKETKDIEHPIRCLTSEGFGYIGNDDVKRNFDKLNHYKVIIGYKVPGSDFTKNDGKFRVITAPKILMQNEVCTQTYVVVCCTTSYETALYIKEYLKTKFARAMILSKISSTTISSSRFENLPNILGKTLPEDAHLYGLFNLTKDEINYIENLIREMQ